MSSRDGWLRRQTNEHNQVVEVQPERCREGHLLRPGRVLVSWDGAHRTYWCRDCEDAGVPDPMLRLSV